MIGYILIKKNGTKGISSGGFDWLQKGRGEKNNVIEVDRENHEMRGFTLGVFLCPLLVFLVFFGDVFGQNGPFLGRCSPLPPRISDGDHYGCRFSRRKAVAKRPDTKV